ncbi:MAG: QacE family quaternary ammonium compound efflux SMR transporter [Chromatiaceae bacterium]|nr:QacE family quaternary ammonium compound efflux SMR transporter [Chromatiaceae bacterium]
MQHWLFLALAILAEVIGTSALKASDGFSRLLPSLVVVVGYLAAFYLLALTLKAIPIGVAYAVWAGAGVALVALIGWIFFGETLTLPAFIGMGFILVGVVILNLFSSSTH